jgi:hypothetical protein
VGLGPDDRARLAPRRYVVTPVHPWQRRHVLAGHFAGLVADGALMPLDVEVPAQVTAALGILKKCVPDLSAVEHTGELTHKHVKELSDAELTAIAAGSGFGAATEATGEAVAPELH